MRLKKVAQVYKNHGVKGVVRKTRNYAQIRIHNLRPKKVSLEEKSLAEEYGFVSNGIFQITSQDRASSMRAISGHLSEAITTATWFVPYYEHFGFNGIQTIFRFIEKLSMEGVQNNIVIYDNPAMDVNKLEGEIRRYFPNITNHTITVFDDDKEKCIASLPASDIAFCTIWVSAYILLKFNKTKRKYYFIQDYEPLFYVAGSTSALAESTYRFGFTGVVNTPGLFTAVHDRHGMQGVSFIPAVNTDLYNTLGKKENVRTRIFLYARPLNPRNAFNLGVLTIKHLLDKYGDKIEIITAGAEWDEAAHGLKGRITNLGLIKSLDEVANAYRGCDIGFAFMLNKHTTYQMLEYAASGMATVMNNNEDHLWLHKNGINCLLAEPSPAAMAEKIGQLVDDPVLRKKLVEGAAKEVSNTWDIQTGIVWEYITKN